MDTKKVGRFRISHLFIRQTPQRTLSKILSNFVPIRAESRYDMEAIEYTALSEFFETVPLGQEPPLYELVIKNGEVVDVKK